MPTSSEVTDHSHIPGSSQFRQNLIAYYSECHSWIFWLECFCFFFFSVVLVHCQLYELCCLLGSDRGCFAQREAACTLQWHFHLAWWLGAWRRAKNASQPRWGKTNRRNMARLSLKTKRFFFFWNSLTFLFGFLPIGTLFRLSSSHKKHLAFCIVLTALFCFYCQCSSR